MRSRGPSPQDLPEPEHLYQLEINTLPSEFQPLRTLGYVEGQNLILERRSAEGQYERFGDIVAELVRLKVDVIVTLAHPAALAAKAVTTTVPIVMAVSADPVGNVHADADRGIATHGDDRGTTGLSAKRFADNVAGGRQCVHLHVSLTVHRQWVGLECHAKRLLPLGVYNRAGNLHRGIREHFRPFDSWVRSSFSYPDSLRMTTGFRTAQAIRTARELDEATMKSAVRRDLGRVQAFSDDGRAHFGDGRKIAVTEILD